MHLSPWLARLALASPLLLPACAPPAPVMVRQEVPAALLECQPQPVPPDPLRDDADLAYFIVDLAAAGADCRAKLERVKALVH